MENPVRYILTLRCLDAPGVIHAVSGAILEIAGNILEQGQFTDEHTGIFSMRTRFETSRTDIAVFSAVADATSRFSPLITLRNEAVRRRAVIMVSHEDHCLVDLLYRHANGELPIDIPMIVSNHATCGAAAELYGIPFTHITATSKQEAEAQLRGIIDELGVDVLILARYMQILSEDFCADYLGRIINIHHSFLPGFKGARPYHQAFERGVKLIGATAHFVTAELDEGPIIEQDVERVTHNQSVEDLAQIGRDLERVVLARAVRLYAEDRVLLDGQRTVIF
jgi:formyltetrahydrofolate deformylase